MLLEICAANYQSAINAQEGGADRIELCAELGIGGITPSYGLIEKVCKNLNIPVFVLIRPRSGNFVYSKAELEIMYRDIQICKDLGCSGIVSGVLTSNFEIDLSSTEKLMAYVRPLEFTFHRGFDLLKNPIASLKQLRKMGVDRVLSSGQESSAVKGLSLLKEMKEYVKGEVCILPGGGINPLNVGVFKSAGFTEVHASASIMVKVGDETKISFNTLKFLDETSQFFSDTETIQALKFNCVE